MARSPWSATLGWFRRTLQGLARRTVAEEGRRREDGGAAPDEGEADDAQGRQRLAGPDADRELERGSEELDEADGRQRQATRRPGEQGQRQDGGRAVGERPEGVDRAVKGDAGAGVLEPQDPGEAERHQQQAFDQQAGLGVDGRAFADDAVAGEAEGQDDGYPRRTAESGGLEGHDDGGQADGDP